MLETSHRNHSTHVSLDWSTKAGLVQGLLVAYFIIFMGTSYHHYYNSQFIAIRNKFHNT